MKIINLKKKINYYLYISDINTTLFGLILI